MIKFVCDRCGREILARPGNVPDYKAIIMLGPTRRDYDLCKCCVAEVEDYLKGKEKNRGAKL